MDNTDFTLNYNGKSVACTQQGTTYLVQISYVPLYLEEIQNNSDEIMWIEKAQQRETALSKELGALIQQQQKK